MKEFDKILYSTGETVEYLKQYVEQQKELIRLEVAEKTAKLISSLSMAVLFVLMGTVVLLFLSVAGALYIGSLINSIPLGFVIVSACYLLILIVVMIRGQKAIINPIIRMVLENLFD